MQNASRSNAKGRLPSVRAKQLISEKSYTIHLQRLTIADGALGSTNRRLPPGELVERDDQSSECHAEIGHQRLCAIFSHAVVEHLNMGLPDVLDEREEDEQLPRREQLGPPGNAIASPCHRGRICCNSCVHRARRGEFLPRDGRTVEGRRRRPALVLRRDPGTACVASSTGDASAAARRPPPRAIPPSFRRPPFP